MTKHIFAPVKTGLSAIFFSLCISVYAQQQQVFEVADTLPVFETTDFNAAAFKLDSVLKRPMVIVFWATWNDASRQLVDELKQAYPAINPVKRAKLQLNIDVVDFCIDTKSDLHQIALKRENYPWPVHLADYKGWESELINKLKIRKIPSLIIIDEQRRVIVVDPELKQLRNVLSNIKVNQELPN